MDTSESDNSSSNFSLEEKYLKSKNDHTMSSNKIISKKSPLNSNESQNMGAMDSDKSIESRTEMSLNHTAAIASKSATNTVPEHTKESTTNKVRLF